MPCNARISSEHYLCFSITTSGWDIVIIPQLTCWQTGCWPTPWFQKLRKRLSQQQKLQQWWLGWLSLQPLVGLDYYRHSMACLLWEIWSECVFFVRFPAEMKTTLSFKLPGGEFFVPVIGLLLLGFFEVVLPSVPVERQGVQAGVVPLKRWLYPVGGLADDVSDIFPWLWFWWRKCVLNHSQNPCSVC